MALPLIGSIAPETFAQANPYLAGAQGAADLVNQNLKNQNQIYANQILGAQAPYAGPQAAADLGYKRSQTAEINQGNIPQLQGMANQANANAGYLGAEANVINQILPYTVGKAKASMYTTPLAQNATQMQMMMQDPVMRKFLQLYGIMPPDAQQQQNNQRYQIPTSNPQMAGAPTNPNAGGNVNLPVPVPTSGGGNLAGSSPPWMSPKAYTGNDPVQNSILYNSTVNPYASKEAMSAADTAGSTGVTNYNDWSKEAQDNAQNYQSFQQAIQQYRKAYDNSKYTGGVWGKTPTTGIESIPFRLGGHDFSNEQLADQGAKNAASLMSKGLFGGKITNTELAYADSLKPGRILDDMASHMSSDFWNEKAARYQELPAFINAAEAKGISAKVAKGLWDQYQNQRPVYDINNRKPNAQFENSWKDFLTPVAVQAQMEGVPYVSAPSNLKTAAEQRAWIQSLNPGDQQTFLSQIRGG